MKRSDNCLAKLDRMNKTLRHEEADRVPISDFFWGAFIQEWRKAFNLPDDVDIYKYYDLDWIVTTPNMDPHIKDFEVLHEDNNEITVRTGFEAVLRKIYSVPMPEYVSYDTDTIEKAEAFEFIDPRDDRRFYSAGDNQIAGVGDGFSRNTPAWLDTVKSYYPDFPVYGSICEANEYMTRIIGIEKALHWIGQFPERYGRFVERANEFALELTKAQIKAAGGLLDGFVVWGDMAYSNNVFYSPDYWRKYYKPGLKKIIDVCHEHGLPVIYHSCGNVNKVYEDFIDMGVDAHNPIEAKADLDVVELRKQYGHQIGFCGNMNVMEWADCSQNELKKIVLTKLNAAKGGGLIFQSDHSVPNSVSPESYDYVVKLVKEYGKYPLKLGEYDITGL